MPEVGQHRSMAMAYLHGVERQHAEDELRSALETLTRCTTSAGDRWYEDYELREHLLNEFEDVIHVRDDERTAT